MNQILVAILSLSLLVAAGHAAAQTNYPEKPIRLIVGFPPGGPTDIVARLLGQKFTEAWGKPVVLENIPGAAGAIGAERAAKATPDGHVLLLSGHSVLVINPGLYDKLRYDPVKDFAPISQVSISSNLLIVHPSLPANNVRELVALAKARPGELTFASGGSGTGVHLAGELLKSMTGIDISHIPYKGVALAIPDLRSGRVTMMFSPMSVGLPLVREGKLRALGVTSAKRSPASPELPTIAESGFPGFEVTAWNGLLAPTATPAAIIRKLHLETAKALALPDVRAKFVDLGIEASSSSPEELAAAIKSEIPTWAKVIREAGIKAD